MPSSHKKMNFLFVSNKKIDQDNDYKYFKNIIIENINNYYEEEKDDIDGEISYEDLDSYDFTHKFINIDEKNGSYYHIYFNDNEENEAKRY